MKLEHTLRNGVAWSWGQLRKPAPLTTNSLRNGLADGRIKKILLIRPHQGIGDLILATPVFRALKDAYPAAELHFLGSPHNVVAVRDNPRLFKVWIHDKRALRRPGQTRAFFRQLRGERFDLALVLFSNAPSLTSFLLARLSGAAAVGSCETRMFYGGTNWSRWLSDWQTPAALKQDPEYVKFFRLVEPLTQAACPAPEFTVPPAVLHWGEQQWKKLALRKDHPPIALFFGGNPKRRDRLWPAAAWAKLASLLAPVAPLVAVCPPRGLRGGGGVPETSLYDEFRAAYGKDIPVFDEPGLPQAAAFLKPMRLFICPDGGLFHVAAAAGVRTLGLFFSSDPTFWRPPLESVRCLRAPEGKPENLSPESVFAAIKA